MVLRSVESVILFATIVENVVTIASRELLKPIYNEATIFKNH